MLGGGHRGKSPEDMALAMPLSMDMNVGTTSDTHPHLPDEDDEDKKITKSLLLF